MQLNSVGAGINSKLFCLRAGPGILYEEVNPPDVVSGALVGRRSLVAAVCFGLVASRPPEGAGAPSRDASYAPPAVRGGGGPRPRLRRPWSFGAAFAGEGRLAAGGGGAPRARVAAGACTPRATGGGEGPARLNGSRGKGPAPPSPRLPRHPRPGTGGARPKPAGRGRRPGPRAGLAVGGRATGPSPSGARRAGHGSGKQRASASVTKSGAGRGRAGGPPSHCAPPGADLARGTAQRLGRPGPGRGWADGTGSECCARNHTSPSHYWCRRGGRNGRQRPARRANGGGPRGSSRSGRSSGDDGGGDDDDVASPASAKDGRPGGAKDPGRARHGNGLEPRRVRRRRRKKDPYQRRPPSVPRRRVLPAQYLTRPPPLASARWAGGEGGDGRGFTAGVPPASPPLNPLL